ncbi:MAG TPA: NAD(P)-dependent oxidoreductase [Tepidisphaeraceae bacterium]|nr:NAD(P)-dependent oxidoreductase [Tepidisphaeraceae bacterium]
MSSAPAVPEAAKAACPLRVVVTGGSGRVGSAVVKRLVAAGHHVINVDRRQAKEPVAQRFVYADLRKREQVQPVLEQPDAVCHLGEIPNPDAPLGADEIFSHNTNVAAVVLQTAADLKLRLVVYTSTCQVYGVWGKPPIPPERLPVDESLPLRPQNVYALSKVANESYARYVGERHGLGISIFRLPWVMSEWNDRWYDWFEKPDGPVPDGLETYVHAEDAAAAYAAAIERSLPGVEAYHFVAEDVMSVVPLRERFERHHPTYPKLPTDWPSHRAPVLTTKAREKLGWQPTFNFLDHYAKSRGRDPRVPSNVRAT